MKENYLFYMLCRMAMRYTRTKSIPMLFAACQFALALYFIFFTSILIINKVFGVKKIDGSIFLFAIAMDIILVFCFFFIFQKNNTRTTIEIKIAEKPSSFWQNLEFFYFLFWGGLFCLIVLLN